MQAEDKSSEEKKADIWSSHSEERPRKESCVKYFDALWFCYCESHHHRNIVEMHSLIFLQALHFLKWGKSWVLLLMRLSSLNFI